MKLRIINVDVDMYEKISSQLHEKLGLNDIQHYFPVMSLFFNYYNNIFPYDIFFLKIFFCQ